MSWSGPLWIYLVWDSLCVLLLWSLFFTRSGKFLVSISSNRFSFFCTLSPPSHTLTMWILLWFGLSQKSLKLAHFFCCSNWVLLATLCSKSNILFFASSNLLLIPSGVFFNSDILFFVSKCLFYIVSLSFFILDISVLKLLLRSLSIFITIFLNSVSYKYFPSIWFSSFFLELLLFFHFGHVWLTILAASCYLFPYIS